MLSCKQITELVTEYIEGRMSLVDRMRFQMHVGLCRHCRTYLRQMRTTMRVLGRLPDAPIPDDVRDELRKRFAEWHSARRSAGGQKTEPA
jgi:predicted anti-sigma-YlaC factor YlaD